MPKQREGLGLGEPTIDLAGIAGQAGQPKPRYTMDEIHRMGEKAGFGFVDRTPRTAKKQRERSPYIVQHNVKLRVGMREVIESIASRLDVSSQVVIERGILALLEKEGFEDIKAACAETMNS